MAIEEIEVVAPMYHSHKRCVVCDTMLMRPHGTNYYYYHYYDYKFAKKRLKVRDFYIRLNCVCLKWVRKENTNTKKQND